MSLINPLLLKRFTDQDIANRIPAPCVPTSTYFYSGWSGTAIDVLNMTAIPVLSRLWATMTWDYILPIQQQRLFAPFCANQLTQTDQRCIDAINAATDFANGNLSEADRYNFEYNAALAIEESPNATETLARMAAMHCVVPSTYAAVLATADIAATGSNANAQAQIQQAIAVFNQYGLMEGQ